MAGKSLEPALRDIIDAIDHIHSKVDGIAFDAFEGDLDRRRIVERNVEIISEASRRLSDELKGRYPEIPWQKVAGIGNILRHDYDAVSPRILWNVARNDLAPLERVCRAELARKADKE